MRTGAATAVAAKYLARRDSSSAGIIACGVQGRSNLEALSHLFRLRTVKAYDVNTEAARSFAHEMSERLQLDIEIVDCPKNAVVGLDIVVTSGPIYKEPKPVIDAGWLSEGAFASLVDFDSYWKGGALNQADRLATDDIGQMDYYRKIGYFSQTPAPYADLGEIITGKKPGRQYAAERNISINLGLALEDMAVAILIYRQAKEREIGLMLPL